MVMGLQIAKSRAQVNDNSPRNESDSALVGRHRRRASGRQGEFHARRAGDDARENRDGSAGGLGDCAVVAVVVAGRRCEAQKTRIIVC